MAILPWRRKRERAERAQLEDLNRLMSYGGTVDFVEGPPYPVPLLPSWERSPLGASTHGAWFMAREIGHNVELSRTAVLLRRYGRGARVAKWGDRYVVVYTLVNSAGETVYYFGGDPMRPSWPLSSEEGYGRNVRAVWSRALDVWPFYRNVHDGLVSCAQPSTGIYQVKDIKSLSIFLCMRVRGRG